MPFKDYRIRKCQLCERQVSLTFHHLIPRKLHRRTHFKKNYSREELHEGIMICRRCHKGVHRLYDEMTLARHFSTLEDLKQDPEIRKHVQWVQKQREQSC